jgi:hypothetical protein
VRKLRYIAPAVAATAGAAMALGPALPANAENKKSYSCTDQLCLWYSKAEGSAHFATNATKIDNLENYDFTNGLIVRNDAHSGANRSGDGLLFDNLYVYINLSPPLETISVGNTTAGDEAVTLDKSLINNEASYVAFSFS